MIFGGQGHLYQPIWQGIRQRPVAEGPDIIAQLREKLQVAIE